MTEVTERPRLTTGHLTGVQETLLIPLLSRAEESRRPDAILHDDKAVELVARLDCDFSPYRQSAFDQFTTTMRTRQFDRAKLLQT